MTDEIPNKRRINDDPVALPPALVPARLVLTGSMVRLEPIDPARHTAALYRAGHTTEAARSSWAFLPWGPFPSEVAMHAQLRDFAASLDRVFFAICDRTTGDAVGVATYLDIQPASGVIEIGGIWFAPNLQRTRAATEALFLMLAYAMDDLGYRRKNVSPGRAFCTGFRSVGFCHAATGLSTTLSFILLESARAVGITIDMAMWRG